MTRIRRVLAQEGGYTLIELLQVMVILTAVLGALTTVFVRAMNSEVEMNARFQAQQEARLAVDRIRREVHCAKALTPSGASASITVTLPGSCPTAGGGSLDVIVTYATQFVAANRYDLRRNGIRVADFITDPTVFAYTPQSPSSKALLRVTLPVNTKPSDTGKTWRLVADVVLRNSPRS